MKALCWYATEDVRVDNVPDPVILNSRDAIIRITSTAICGSDLHLYGGFVASMMKGDILGHEFMGEIVELGRDVTNLKKGDRVIVPFAIACGKCFFCAEELYSLCDNTNPNAGMQEKLFGQPTSALFGYSHIFGGYSGGQAEYARVPFADVGCFKVPDGLADEQVLFLTDILPTGWQAAKYCDIKKGDTVAVWGCGPVGQMAIRSAYILGAHRVIAIDRFPDRLTMAREQNDAHTIDYTQTNVVEELMHLTGGRGPDSCIDAVGMEAHGVSAAWYVDRAKQSMMLETDRPYVFRETIMACRKGGVVSLPGVYTGLIDNVPMGIAFAKGLTFRMGQTHVHKFLPDLMHRIETGELDASFVVTHRLPLAEAPEAYKTFQKKKDNCIKVVLKP